MIAPFSLYVDVSLSPAHQSPRGTDFAVASAASFALYLVTACRTVPFGDGGELIAAAASLGVAHPPGYPLYTLLGWLALQIPVGEAAFRVNLLSALFGGLCVGLVATWIRRATGSSLAALAGSGALAVSSTFWWISTVAEVYSLHLSLLVGLLFSAWIAGRSGSTRSRSRAWFAAGVVLGLGLAHHPTIVLALPAAAILAWPSRGADARRPGIPWRSAALGGLVGGLLLVGLVGSLVWRSRLHPASNWGRPDQWATLIPHVTAAAYRHFDLGWAGLIRPQGWSRLVGVLVHEFTPVALPLALAGWIGIPRATAAGCTRRLRLALAVLFAGSIVFGLRYATEDVEVFYLPALVALAAAAALGIAALASHPRRALRITGALFAIGLVAAPLVTHLQSRRLAGMTAAADYGRDILGTLPPNSTLFVEADDAFVLTYLHQVLGERPDVTIYHRNGVLFRDLIDEFTIAPLSGEPGRSYRIRTEQSFILNQLSANPARGIYFLGWPGYEAPPGFRLEPIGLLYRVVAQSAPLTDDRSVWTRYHGDSVLVQARRVHDAFGIGLAATYPLARGERQLFLGHRAAAYDAFDEASRIAEATSGIHSYIGTLYGRLGDYDRAIAAFNRAIEIKPFYVEALNNLGLANQLAGKPDQARAAWRRSLALVPDQTEIVDSLGRLGGLNSPR